MLPKVTSRISVNTISTSTYLATTPFHVGSVTVRIVEGRGPKRFKEDRYEIEVPIPVSINVEPQDVDTSSH